MNVIACSREGRALARYQDAIPCLVDKDSAPSGRRALRTKEVVAPYMDLTLQHKDDTVVVPVVMGQQACALS